jgi:hypothetical protein
MILQVVYEVKVKVKIKMDEFLASDTFYLFQPPLYYRLPSNTDELFADYIANPSNYQDNTIPKVYILQRHYDLKHDLEEIQSAGMSEDNAKKYYYYKGLVASFESLVKEMNYTRIDSVLQSHVLELRNLIQTDLNNIRASGMTHDNGLKYNYHKGRMTAYEQILLNSELVSL